MKIHHIRNATMIIEANDRVILVDPMIGPAGTIPPFSFVRFKPKRNPIVPFPENCRHLLNEVTHCLITHQHPDHCDRAGKQWLSEKGLPVYCSVKDEAAFKKMGLNVVQSIDYWKRIDFLDGKIEGIPARHGYGVVAKTMGNVMGYYIELPRQPSVYLSSDTIYTAAVDKVLKEYQPDIAVVASGSAQLDVLKPILMTVEDILTFVRHAPKKVIANHLEAVNHCPTTRNHLKTVLSKQGLEDKVWIPEDGEELKIA